VSTAQDGECTGGYVTLVEHVEHNSVGGEIWQFHIPVTGNEDALDALERALADREDYKYFDPPYRLEMYVIPEAEVDFLVTHSRERGGYIPGHTKLEGKLVLTNEILERISDIYSDIDPLYKGSIRELMRSST
jgi:hypothetical protein